MEGDRDMYRQFQDWCLRTYGDSGKTKTVTRKKYDRIVQLLNGSESSSTDNAKFKFWVKSKGFQLGISGEEKQVLYVPVKTADSVGMDEKVSLRQVAVVEDFFDIIYSMHVENVTSGEKSRKHAGQKRTYKAISETYAFLPREAVTRFLMSCSECQKRMHLNAEGTEHRENGKAPTLVTSIIDYNMPITMAYMKHMRLQLLNAQNDEEDSSLDSDEYDMSDSTRMSAVNSDLSSNLEERMASPQTLHAQQDDDSTADSINGNDGVTYHALTTRLNHSGSAHNSNGKVPEQQEQPLNLSDCPLLAACHTDNHTTNGRSKYKILGLQDLKTETKDNVSKSPAHSYSSYDSGKNEAGGLEDVSLNRADDDEDDQDDQDDCEKAMEVDGAEAERLKAFNSRPIPSHLTSAAAENILASACENESRNAAKRMRLDRRQDEAVSPDKGDAALLTTPASTAPAAQEVLYINGNGAYSCHSYGGVGGGLLDLTEAASSGPTDLSMKKQQSSSGSGTSRPQLNPTEVNAVRQLIAGYRESAAFLLRSADELESILLQQN
ncbi:nucleolar protein 4-like isoform X3 [Brienomyrus brachyistius]|uniref:nucleolar protein 4-like isoform X3 n=1 Tax=Brienomyrus brachyistius TaxID=42636 RepID=UPI0020B199B1|nr:nucleolar protein 4-like isoform X3 [Brienomyrus brachyistius]